MYLFLARWCKHAGEPGWEWQQPLFLALCSLSESLCCLQLPSFVSQRFPSVSLLEMLLLLMLFSMTKVKTGPPLFSHHDENYIFPVENESIISLCSTLL